MEEDEGSEDDDDNHKTNKKPSTVSKHYEDGNLENEADIEYSHAQFSKNLKRPLSIELLSSDDDEFPEQPTTSKRIVKKLTLDRRPEDVKVTANDDNDNDIPFVPSISSDSQQNSLSSGVTETEKSETNGGTITLRSASGWKLAVQNEGTVRRVIEIRTTQNGAGGSVEEKHSALNSRHHWQRIGGGTFADVYKALYNGNPVAVKQFRLDGAHFESNAKKTAEEAELLKSLAHENVIAFIDYIKLNSSNGIFLVTELVDGGDMRRFCYGDKMIRIGMNDKRFIAKSCWNGLAYLHNRNVCHKDIKPANILVSDNVQIVKIADFGLAELKLGASAHSTKLQGTCLYYPPEFASKENNGEFRVVRHAKFSDVYSMGASLCELFSGRYFWFTGDNQPREDCQVMYKLIEQIERIAKSLPEIEPDCWKFIVDHTIRKFLKLAIMSNYLHRKSAAELFYLF